VVEEEKLQAEAEEGCRVRSRVADDVQREVGCDCDFERARVSERERERVCV